MSGSRRRVAGERPGSEPANARAAAAGAPAGRDSALVLATRGSALALAQTRLVGDALAAAHPGIVWRLLTISTRGDRSADAGPSADAGRGGVPPPGGSARGGGAAMPGPVAAGERQRRAGGGAGGLTGTAGTVLGDGNGDAPGGEGRTGGHAPPAPPTGTAHGAGAGDAGSGSVARRVVAAGAGPPAGGEPPAAGSELAALARVRPGVFTSELAAAVARGEADAAVHSLKDLPLADPAGLCLAAILARAAAGDVLVVAPRWYDAAAPLGLRGGATVGTSSPRRAALLRRFAPQARVVEVRGNVPTRLRRCSEGALAAVVLAQAGLQRLGSSPAGLRVLPLPPEHWQPAPGQGALAVQARRGDRAADLLAALDHAPTRTAVALERSVLRALGGGCAAPCGAYARAAGGGKWELHYGVAEPGAGWRSYRLLDTAGGCRNALDAWAAGGPRPRAEASAPPTCHLITGSFLRCSC